jgi:uncharacterized protein YqjF (DUF2071 family)
LNFRIFAVHSPISSLAEEISNRNSSAPARIPTRELSLVGKQRLLSKNGEPLFLAAWNRAVFINYEADARLLQRQVPFELDLRDRRAFVSVVAFTLSRMRPRLGGRLGEWLFKPIATHEFLNVRTYVRHRGEPGIYFLAEWLSNPLSVRLGPRTFGLPYKFGRLSYDHARASENIHGNVEAREGLLSYRGMADDSFAPSDAGSLTEFMLERYTAFTCRGKRRRLFHIWHSPWPQVPAEIEVTASTLMASTGGWWKTAEYIGANYSPGVEVWMGRPHRI